MRKLCFGAIGYTCALAIAHYLLPEAWLISAAVLCVVFALLAFLLKGTPRKKTVIVFSAAAIGFAWSWWYTDLFVLPAEAYADTVQTLSVRIAEEPNIRLDYSSVEGVCISKDFPRGRILIYDYDGGMESLQPGDLVEMTLRMKSVTQRYNTADDFYLAAGIHYRAVLDEPYTITGRAKLAWIYFPQTLARELKNAALSAFPDDVAPLMKALLTGDKSEFYENDALYCAFETSGFSHIIAVSGMHVAFLVGFLSLLIGKRRRTAIIGIPAILVFLAMVGFTPSATRAGIMQILLLIAPVFRRENDSPTSLAAALLILLAVNPTAIGSVSLQFSFSAMAGLLLVSPRVYLWLTQDGCGKSRIKKGFWGKLTRSIYGSLASSVGALVFTTPISAICFGFMPLYGILTNLLCLWAMSAAFLCGYLVCVLWMLWHPIGLVVGWAIAWLPRYVIAVVRLIAKLPYAQIVTQGNLCAWWIVYVYLLLSSTYLLKGKDRYRPVIPICCCLISFASVSLLMQKKLDGQVELTAIDVGQGLSFAAMTENATVLIDCGGTGSADNAGDVASVFLRQSGRGSVDLLVLSHFHSDHANGVERLTSRVNVKRIAVPACLAEDDDARQMLNICTALGSEVIYIAENTDISLDGLQLTLYAPRDDDNENENERCLMVRGSYGEFDFLSTGDAGSAAERQLTESYDLGDIDLLVVGHHGSRYSTCDTLLDEMQPEYAMISVGANNSYGHPAVETLARLANRDIMVYRTDLNGTISITAGYNNG